MVGLGRNILFLMGLLLVVLIQVIHSPNEQAPYLLLVTGRSAPDIVQNSLYAIDFATLESHLVSDQISDWDGVTQVYVAPDGYSVAFLNINLHASKPSIWIMNHTLSPHKVVENPDELLGWSQDGKFILYRDYTINRIRPDGTDPHILTLNPLADLYMRKFGDWFYYRSWTANENYFAYLLEDTGRRELKLSAEIEGLAIMDNWFYYRLNNELFRIRLDGSQQETLITYPLQDEFSFRLNATGTAGLLWHNNSVYLTDAKGVVRADLEIDLEAVKNMNYALDVRFSPDGAWLFFNTAGGLARCRIEAIDCEQVASIPAENMLWAVGMLSHPNSKWVFFKFHEQIYRVDMASLELTQLTDLAGIKQFESISPDGQWLVFQNTTDQRTIYRMKTDGSQLERLSNDTELFSARGWLQTPTYPYHYSGVLFGGVGFIVLGSVLYAGQCRLHGKV